ncbi:MAG: hypothetical protein FWC73_10095 [Defluviitaleaceae bacterium]|nr:hypothetical protein [Defluviitaleaceae bacterium]
MRNSPDRTENRERFYMFSATGWTDFELIRYTTLSNEKHTIVTVLENEQIHS